MKDNSIHCNDNGAAGGDVSGGKNAKNENGRWRYSSIAIALGLALASLHTILSVARSTHVVVSLAQHHPLASAASSSDAAASVSSRRSASSGDRAAAIISGGLSHTATDRTPLKTKVDFITVNEEMRKRENDYSGMWWYVDYHWKEMDKKLYV